MELCGLLWCLNSHSDGTHSLQRIPWWTSNVMLNIPNLLRWKTTKHEYFHISHYLELVLFPTQPKIEFVVASIPVIFRVPFSRVVLLGIKVKLCRICRHFSHFMCRFWKKTDSITKLARINKQICYMSIMCWQILHRPWQLLNLP